MPARFRGPSTIGLIVLRDVLAAVPWSLAGTTAERAAPGAPVRLGRAGRAVPGARCGARRRAGCAAAAYRAADRPGRGPRRGCGRGCKPARATARAPRRGRVRRGGARRHGVGFLRAAAECAGARRPAMRPDPHAQLAVLLAKTGLTQTDAAAQLGVAVAPCDAGSREYANRRPPRSTGSRRSPKPWIRWRT